MMATSHLIGVGQSHPADAIAQRVGRAKPAYGEVGEIRVVSRLGGHARDITRCLSQIRGLEIPQKLLGNHLQRNGNVPDRSVNAGTGN